jgi:desulfoferrodoxin-like iron-binding protein
MNVFICSVCGQVEFNQAPVVCPVCNAAGTKYTRNDRVFAESAEKSKEAAVKHIPSIVVNKKCGLVPELPCVDVIVRIGATLHPMESAHFIAFMDCYVDLKYVARVFLTPGVVAAGCFHLKSAGSKVTIVEKCNIHGYWMADAAL